MANYQFSIPIVIDDLKTTNVIQISNKHLKQVDIFSLFVVYEVSGFFL